MAFKGEDEAGEADEEVLEFGCDGEANTFPDVSSLRIIFGDSCVGSPCGEVADVIVVLLLPDFIEPALVELLFLEGLGEFDFNDADEFVIKFFELCSDEEVVKLRLLGEVALFSDLSFSLSFFSVFLLDD